MSGLGGLPRPWERTCPPSPEEATLGKFLRGTDRGWISEAAGVVGSSPLELEVVRAHGHSQGTGLY